MTRDSVMALFLLKLRYDSPYRKLSIEFGVPKTRLCRIFNEVLQYVYSKPGPPGQPTWLHRQRNLAQPQNLRDFYEEVHQSTLRNQRAATLLVPRVPPNMRLVVLEWDSRPCLIDKSSDHYVQRRSWSTKEI